MTNRQEIDRFLRTVERRALQMAQMATRHHADALDIVQDSMIKWAKLYHEHDTALWHMLFFKVLQSRLTDWHRRQAVKRKVFFWMPWSGEEIEEDPIEQFADTPGQSPDDTLEYSQTTKALVKAIEKLPMRQQQVFMLRQWEGLSVSETADALGISEGSVKTHLSRALDALKGELKRQCGEL